MRFRGVSKPPACPRPITDAMRAKLDRHPCCSWRRWRGAGARPAPSCRCSTSCRTSRARWPTRRTGPRPRRRTRRSGTSPRSVVPSIAQQFQNRFRYGVGMFPGASTTFACTTGGTVSPVPSHGRRRAVGLHGQRPGRRDADGGDACARRKAYLQSVALGRARRPTCCSSPTACRTATPRSNAATCTTIDAGVPEHQHLLGLLLLRPGLEGLPRRPRRGAGGGGAARRRASRCTWWASTPRCRRATTRRCSTPSPARAAPGAPTPRATRRR